MMEKIYKTVMVVGIGIASCLQDCTAKVTESKFQQLCLLESFAKSTSTEF